MKLYVIHKSCQRRFAQFLASDLVQVKSFDGGRWSVLLWFHDPLHACRIEFFCPISLTHVR